MYLFTEKPVSPVGQVNQTDLKQVGRNMMVFLAPLALVYLLQLSGSLQNGSLDLKGFMPTRMTLGAIELYVVNALMDLLRKFTNK